MENSSHAKTTVHGPVGARVAANVHHRREELKMSQRELALKLRELNGAVEESDNDPDVRSTINTISKTEKRKRRIDVDDLTVLAVALKTTPNWLMYHEEPVSPTARMWIYGLQPLRQETVLNWANGRKPLDWGGDAVQEGGFKFRQTQRPFEPNYLPRDMPNRFEDTEQFAILKKAMEDVIAAGVDRDLVVPLMNDVVKRTAEGWVDAEEMLRQAMTDTGADDA
jgi:transcriptional regulator with XRE-family HTH domain